jgi:hypothetical protein
MKLNHVSTFSGKGQIEIISRFCSEGLGVATKTIERFVARAVHLGLYVRPWHKWLRCITSEKTFVNQYLGRLLTLFQTFHFSGHLGVFRFVYRCRFNA